MNVGGEGAVFFFLSFDADEHGDGVWVALDLALDDDFGTASFFFVEADPDAFDFDVVGEHAFLAGFEGVGEPGVDLAFGDVDSVAAFGGELDHSRDAGGIFFAVIFSATGDVAEVLGLEAEVDSKAERADEGEGKEDEEALHGDRVAEVRGCCKLGGGREMDE